jgi:hypothetical protein
MMKKTWTAPVVEELAIANTLGGNVLTATESFFPNGSINLTGGSVFPNPLP